jgi:hypothetical protein
VFGEAAQNQHADIIKTLSYCPQYIHAAFARQGNIQQHKVAAVIPERFHQDIPGRRIQDHFETRFVGQQLLEPAAYDLVVIDDGDSYRAENAGSRHS